MIVALSGGVGGAKLALGLSRVLPPEELVVVVNTGDDFEHLGLSISPDIDTVLYTLSGLANRELGWGRHDETWSFMETMETLGGETWFRLGDRDLIGLGFARGAVTPPPAPPVLAPPPDSVKPRPPVDPGPKSAIVFSKETFGWKKQFREVATDLMLTSDASNGDEALDSLLLCLTNDLEVDDALRSEGVDLAAIGDALQMVCSPRGISTRGKKLGVRLSESVARMNGLHQLGLEVRPTGEEGVVHLYRS